ncbi:MAG: ABC transporter ATP-binding protein [Gammaproteobacteria bacterium]|nr:ABC transporter ATP-binding protein [Gammaproteobacteria bacterium]
MRTTDRGARGSAPLVAARRLGKSYFDGGRGHTVLAGIDLDIRAGELVVILGRSGSGKSTLLNLLGVMDHPDHGELSIAGTRVDRLDEDRRSLFRRRHIGFVFQSYNLLPTLTVAENLSLPLELNGADAETAAARVAGLLSELGLDARANAFPDQLSGGEQQRIAVARALVHRPTLVIADEPTGNLDLDTGRQVLQLLDTLTRAEGRTLVMATHSREVMGIADRILTIVDGRLLEQGRT